MWITIFAPIQMLCKIFFSNKHQYILSAEKKNQISQSASEKNISKGNYYMIKLFALLKKEAESKSKGLSCAFSHNITIIHTEE